MSIVTRALALETTRELRRALVALPNWHCTESSSTSIHIGFGTPEAFYVHLNVDQQGKVRLDHQDVPIGPLYSPAIFEKTAHRIIELAWKLVLPFADPEHDPYIRAEIMEAKSAAFALKILDRNDVSWGLQVVNAGLRKIIDAKSEFVVLAMKLFLSTLRHQLTEGPMASYSQELDTIVAQHSDAANSEFDTAMVVRRLHQLADDVSSSPVELNRFHWYARCEQVETLMLASGAL